MERAEGGGWSWQISNHVRPMSPPFRARSSGVLEIMVGRLAPAQRVAATLTVCKCRGNAHLLIRHRLEIDVSEQKLPKERDAWAVRIARSKKDLIAAADAKSAVLSTRRANAGGRTGNSVGNRRSVVRFFATGNWANRFRRAGC